MLGVFATYEWWNLRGASSDMWLWWAVPFMIGTIWYLMDLILGVMGRAKDSHGSPIKRWWNEASVEGAPLNEDGKLSFGKVISVIVRAAIVTVVVLAILFVVGGAVAANILPDNISYVQNGRCDVGNEPARYVLTSEDGQVEEEFCLKHAVLYDMSVHSYLGNDTLIKRCPLEIRFLSFWLLVIVSVAIAIPVSLWWESRGARKGRRT
jgi:hypothetical protein